MTSQISIKYLKEYRKYLNHVSLACYNEGKQRYIDKIAAIDKAIAELEQTTVKQEQEPVLWQWRRKKDAPFWELKHTSSVELFATTDDSEVRRLYEHPPADAQQQEIERLKAEIEVRKDCHDHLLDTANQLSASRDELEAQLAEYKADAERYQRARILGAVINAETPLLRFTNLDAHLDADIKLHPSRGEFKGGKNV